MVSLTAEWPKLDGIHLCRGIVHSCLGVQRRRCLLHSQRSLCRWGQHSWRWPNLCVSLHPGCAWPPKRNEEGAGAKSGHWTQYKPHRAGRPLHRDHWDRSVLVNLKQACLPAKSEHFSISDLNLWLLLIQDKLLCIFCQQPSCHSCLLKYTTWCFCSALPAISRKHLSESIIAWWHRCYIHKEELFLWGCMSFWERQGKWGIKLCCAAPGNLSDVKVVSNESYFHANAYLRLNVSQSPGHSSQHRQDRAAELQVKWLPLDAVETSVETIRDSQSPLKNILQVFESCQFNNLFCRTLFLLASRIIEVLNSLLRKVGSI